MFLSDLSIKQPVLATMMMAALAVLGLTSYRALKVDLFPDVEFPVVVVTTRYTGASPETVERDVTKKIEESVNTVEGVRHIESTSQEGLSTIVVNFNIGVPTLNATQAMVRGTARGATAAQIAEIPVKRVGQRTLLVRDVAQVIDGVEEARSLAFVDDKPAIALDVQKQAGANTVAVADGVREAVIKMAPELPPGVSLQMVRDDSTFIRESIDDVQVTLVLGGLLTIFIVFLF